MSRPVLTPEARAVVKACTAMAIEVEALEAFLCAQGKAPRARLLVAEWRAMEDHVLVLASVRTALQKRKGVQRGVRWVKRKVKTE